MWRSYIGYVLVWLVLVRESGKERRMGEIVNGVNGVVSVCAYTTLELAVATLTEALYKVVDG